VNGSAMSREAMLASLGDIRLPVDAAGGVIADLAAVGGLAALAALIAVGLLRGAGSKRAFIRRPTPAERRAALQALQGEERRVAMLHLLKELAPHRYAAFGGRLYLPDGVPLNEIESEVSRLA